jgi:type I restriction enzyme S subunit
MSNWKIFRLGELAEIIGGGTPSTNIDEYWNGDIPWLTPRDLTNYNFKYIKEGERLISEEGLRNSSAKLLPKGAVLLTSRAPIGYLAIAENVMCTNQGFKSFVVNEKKLDHQFLYYLLKNNVEYLKSLGTGTTFAEISATTLKTVEFIFPDKDTQTQIASILSSIDNKIELNIQMNQTLEALAQAIFKEWFMKFNFPGFDGTIVNGLPKGWRIGKLGEILELQYGKALISENRIKGKYPVVGSNGIVDFHNEFLVKAPGIVIGRKGTIGEVIWLDENFFPIDTTFFVKDLIGIPGLFYHYFLLINQDFKKITSDSAVPGLNRNQALANDVVIPNIEIIKLFNDLIKPLFEKKFEIKIENQTLTQIRDSLLPKLMSGKIEIKE